MGAFSAPCPHLLAALPSTLKGLPAWSALLPGAGSPGGTHACAQTLCLLFVCLSAHPSSSCQPSAPASQKPHPCGSERVGWRAPPETALPAVKEAGGGLHFSSGRAVSSDCLSECPDHQGSMAARSHVIKDQVSLKTRPCRSLRPRLQRQRTCRPSSETPGHPVSGKRGRRGQRAHLGRALPLQARQCTPPGGAPASPFLSQPPLPVTPSGSATSLLHFSPLYSSVLTPSSLQKLTHCDHSDANPPSYASSDLRTSTPTSTCCIIIGMLSGLARRLWHRAGPVFSRFRGAPGGSDVAGAAPATRARGSSTEATAGLTGDWGVCGGTQPMTPVSTRPPEESQPVPRTKVIELQQGIKERYSAKTNRTSRPSTKTTEADTDLQQDHGQT